MPKNTHSKISANANTNLNENSNAKTNSQANALSSHFSQISYKNFIALAFALVIIYALSFAAMRAVLAFDTFGAWQNDFGKMFFVGFGFDMRVVCTASAVIMLAGYLASAASSLSLSLSLSRCERTNA